MKARVLITGGAGYIGSVLTQKLLSAGYHVHVYDNFQFKQQSLMHMAGHANLEITCDDIRNKASMRAAIKSADIIIPLAAVVGAPACHRDPIMAKSVNLDAPLEFLLELSSQQVLLMPTTNSAYGQGDANNFCNESSPLNPISSYAKWKVEVESFLLQKTNGISFRLATVFGISPRMRLDLLVNDFTYRALTDRFIVLFEAHFKRNFIHLDDVANVFLHGIENYEAMKGQVYNVGLSDANFSKLELCQIIKKYLPEFTFLEAPIGKDPDQRNYIVSNEKIEKTGYRAKKKIDDGVQEIIRFRHSLFAESQRNA